MALKGERTGIRPRLTLAVVDLGKGDSQIRHSFESGKLSYIGCRTGKPAHP